MLFGDKGYIEFKYEEQIAKWAEFAGKKGNEILANPNQLAKWLQCEGTWFVGVDVLPNDSQGNFLEVNFPRTFSSLMENINLKGIMALPKLTNDKKERDDMMEEVINLSVKLQKIYPNASAISLGTTSDYEDAIIHGSNMLRIGESIFGKRS